MLMELIQDMELAMLASTVLTILVHSHHVMIMSVKLITVPWDMVDSLSLPVPMVGDLYKDTSDYNCSF